MLETIKQPDALDALDAVDAFQQSQALVVYSRRRVRRVRRVDLQFFTPLLHLDVLYSTLYLSGKIF
jgi:hypothetical protein